MDLSQKCKCDYDVTPKVNLAGGDAGQKGMRDTVPTTSAMVTAARVQGRDSRMELGPKASFLTQGNAVFLLFLNASLGYASIEVLKGQASCVCRALQCCPSYTL